MNEKKTNRPPVNPPLHDEKAGRARRSRREQNHEVPGRNKQHPIMEHNIMQLIQQIEPQQERMQVKKSWN